MSPSDLWPSCSNTCGFATAWEPAWVFLGCRFFISLALSGYLHGCGALKLSVPADATGLDPHVLRWESSTKAVPAARGAVESRAELKSQLSKIKIYPDHADAKTPASNRALALPALRPV